MCGDNQYTLWQGKLRLCLVTHFFKNSPTAFTTAAWSTSFTVTPGIYRKIRRKLKKFQ